MNRVLNLEAQLARWCDNEDADRTAAQALTGGLCLGESLKDGQRECGRLPCAGLSGG